MKTEGRSGEGGNEKSAQPRMAVPLSSGGWRRAEIAGREIPSDRVGIYDPRGLRSPARPAVGFASERKDRPLCSVP